MKYGLVLAAVLSLAAFGVQADEACATAASEVAAAKDGCAGKEAAANLTKSSGEACATDSAAAALLTKTDASADADACHTTKAAKTDSEACHTTATAAAKTDAAACHTSDAAKLIAMPSAAEMAAQITDGDLKAAAEACTAKTEEACAAEIASKVADAADEEIAAVAEACAAEKNADLKVTKSEAKDCCAEKVAATETEQPSGD